MSNGEIRVLEPYYQKAVESSQEMIMAPPDMEYWGW